MSDDNVPTKVLETVLEQELGDSAAIRRLFLGNEAFRSACEDFALASEMLRKFKSAKDGSRVIEVSDYQDMKATLRDELRQIIGQSTARGASSGALR